MIWYRDTEPRILHVLEGKAAFALALCKAAEFLESITSSCVQGYDLAFYVDMSDAEEQQLQFSVVVSILALANFLTLLDKDDSHVRGEEAAVSSIASLNFVLIL